MNMDHLTRLADANAGLIKANNCLRSALREAYWTLPPGAADRLQARYPQIVNGFIAEQEEAEERLLERSRS